MIAEINNLDRSLPFKTFAEYAAEIRAKKAKKAQRIAEMQQLSAISHPDSGFPAQDDPQGPKNGKMKNRVKNGFGRLKRKPRPITSAWGACAICGSDAIGQIYPSIIIKAKGKKYWVGPHCARCDKYIYAPKRKSRPKKIKRKSLAKLKGDLRKLVHAKIIKRDIEKYGGFCPTCKYRRGYDTEKITTPCHILPVGDYPGIQFLEANIYGGCGPCNFAERNRRSLWANIFREWIGDSLYSSMEQEGRKIHKWDRGELESEIARLSQEGLEVKP